MSSMTRFQIEASVTGMEGVKKLQNSIKQLQKSTLPTSLEITKLRTAAKALGAQSDLTENDLRTQISVFTELRASVSLTSQKYQLLTRDIQKAERALAKAAATGKRSSFSFRGAAKTLGAVAGSAVFGGPEGAIGAGIGGIIGGPQGALFGGAIGAQVGQFRRTISETTEYSASLALQRKALSLVIADTNKYSKAQEFLSRKSKRLAIPQDVIVRQFTALTASVKGAGRSTEDAQKVFESIASGIRGTGGSLEDMKAAMTATAQVFSKGKVSAEELRQQLGERLPGAFTIFAESMGKTPAELDKALEGGKVTLDDFMTFSEMLFKKYGENAEILAAGPEAAGDRLATAMAEFKDNVGQILAPAGAAFQDIVEKNMIRPLSDAAQGFREFLKIGGEYIQDDIDQVQKSLDDHIRSRDAIKRNIGDRTDTPLYGLMQTQQAWVDMLQNRLNNLKLRQAELNGEISNTVTVTEKMGKTGSFVWDNMMSGAMAYKESIKDINKQIQDATKAAFTKMEDALVDFVMTGKTSFKEFASSVIADITRIFIRSQILGMFDGLGSLFNTNKSVKGTISGPNWGGGRYRMTSGSMPQNVNALGNVYGKNGIVPFAKGGIVDGIVNKPTIFPFANGGVGLMGEAGYPEAIIPLKRGRDGKLGVAGGGGTSVVVNVDASGSDVQGDEGNAASLGRAISFAVTEEIAKQKRPGGLLSAA